MTKLMHAKQILRHSKLFANQAQRILCSVCWGEPKEEVHSSNFILESAFVSEVVKYSRGRIRIQSSNGWSHNSLQRRDIR
ncbi:hypothetical protein Gotri_021494 [Gossypium trilobum]|uniref:Uncharacterized protein n=1 Tax=Gossypium trilobum TaxID=34281 RepID=A0A7J9DDG8_9ROSI|nr:hypothetical protein [Gossypium trilobum]